MTPKIFDNGLVAIRKHKFTLTLNKPPYVGMWKLDLSKVLMYELYYDYIKNEHGNKPTLLFVDTGSLMYELKTKDILEDFSKDKKLSDFSNYSTKSKCYDYWNKLVVDKIKDETTSVPVKEFTGLKPKMYSFLVDDSSQYTIAIGVNKNVVAAKVIINTKMFCWKRLVWDIEWTDSKIKIIE